MNGKHLILGTDTLDEIEKRAHELLDGKLFNIAICDSSGVMRNKVKMDEGGVNQAYVVTHGGRFNRGIIVYPERNQFILNVQDVSFGMTPSDKAEFYFADNLMAVSVVAPAGTKCNWVFMVEDHG